MRSLSIFTNIVLLGLSTLVLVVVVVAGALYSLPDVRQLEKCFTTSMYEVRLCPGGPNYVKLKEISPYAIHAVIASEDGSFYSHEGFDFHEMEESLKRTFLKQTRDHYKLQKEELIRIKEKRLKKQRKAASFSDLNKAKVELIKAYKKSGDNLLTMFSNNTKDFDRRNETFLEKKNLKKGESREYNELPP